MKLTDQQLTAFKKLWFIYGNGGTKCTLLNHKLIQGFIEAGEDRREAYRQAEKNVIERYGKDHPQMKELPTQECFEVCDLILNGRIDSAIKKAKREND